MPPALAGRGCAVRTQRSADLTMGAVVAGLGAVALYGALQIQNLDDQGLRSYTFPLLIGLLLLATGGTLATSAYRAGQDKPLEWPDQAGFRRMAVVLGSVALFVASRSSSRRRSVSVRTNTCPRCLRLTHRWLLLRSTLTQRR